MAGLCPISSINRCYGCWSSNEDKKLEIYYVKKLIFRTILQMEQLVLCYICKRVALQTEKFIHNVETSQALLADSKNDLYLSYDNYKSIIHPLINLTYKANDTIALNGDKLQDSQNDDDIKPEIEDIAEFAVEIQVKQEDTAVEDDENNYHSDIDFQEDQEKVCKSNRITKKVAKKKSSYRKKIIKSESVKEEKDDIFNYPSTGDKGSKSSLKDFCSKVVNLSREEIMEERRVKATEQKYLESAFKCQDCIKGFIMKTPYENHMKLHDKSRGEYECDICRQRMNTKTQFEHHYKYHVERYQCAKCDVTRNCWVSLKDHFLRKHEKGHYEYSCPVCFRQFRFRGTMQKHKSSQHDNRERMKCRHCDKTFATESALANHLKFRHTLEESVQMKRYTCNECGRSYKRLQLLKRHLASHSDNRDYYCVECDKSFKTRSALTTHLKSTVAHVTNNYDPNRTDNKDFMFSCDQCDRRFPNKRYLKRHTSTVHIEETHQCSQCGKTFKMKSSLRAHLLAHEGLEPPKKHVCTVCNKRFHEKGILAKHMNTHTGAKPFQCSQCPAQFGHNGSLYNHVKLVHLHLTRKGTPKEQVVRKPRN